MTADRQRILAARAATIVLAAALWWMPPPAGLSLQAWRLFALFAAAIGTVIAGGLPILTASVLAMALAVLTGLLESGDAYATALGVLSLTPSYRQLPIYQR